MCESNIFSKPLTAEDARAMSVWSVLNNEDTIKHIFKKVEEAIEQQQTYINFAEDPYWDNVDALSPIILGYLRRLGYRFFRNGSELCMTWFEDDAYIRGVKGEEE